MRKSITDQNTRKASFTARLAYFFKKYCKKYKKRLTILLISNIIIVPHYKGSEKLLDRIKTEGFENVYEVDVFKKEFRKITGETKSDQRYHKWLKRQLTRLEDLGMKALMLDGFEPLSNTDPRLYSIRYNKSPLNPRVIYIYANGEEIYLLAAFKESSKKSNSDYNNAIKIAHERLKYLSEYIDL